MYKDTLLSLFPNGPWSSEAPVFSTLIGAIGAQMDAQTENGITLVNNFSPYTADINGITQWEQVLGLPSDPSVGIETRRQRVIVKSFRMNGALTKAKLIALLQNIDVTATVAWGAYVLPISIQIALNSDEYDFGNIVSVLEPNLPAHITYSFRLIPPDINSGYTLYGDHIAANQVALQPESGTLYTGRSPVWNTQGNQLQDQIVWKSSKISADCIFTDSGDLYSGSVVAPSNVTSVVPKLLTPVHIAITGIYSLPKCGTVETAQVPVVSSDGTLQKSIIQTMSERPTGISPFVRSGETESGVTPEVVTCGSFTVDSLNVVGSLYNGNGQSFPCGAYECGEEVA